MDLVDCPCHRPERLYYKHCIANDDLHRYYEFVVDPAGSRMPYELVSLDQASYRLARALLNPRLMFDVLFNAIFFLGFFGYLDNCVDDRNEENDYQ